MVRRVTSNHEILGSIPSGRKILFFLLALFVRSFAFFSLWHLIYGFKAYIYMIMLKISKIRKVVTEAVPPSNDDSTTLKFVYNSPILAANQASANMLWQSESFNGVLYVRASILHYPPVAELQVRSGGGGEGH